MEKLGAYRLFLSEDLFLILESLRAETLPLWGQMNAQQMVEHLALPLALGAAKVEVGSPYEAEQQAKSRAYIFELWQPLSRNLRLPFVQARPQPCIHANLETAIAHLRKLTEAFLEYWQHNPDSLWPHPSFGLLNVWEWHYFQCLHIRHHLVQFGLFCPEKILPPRF